MAAAPQFGPLSGAQPAWGPLSGFGGGGVLSGQGAAPWLDPQTAAMLGAAAYQGDPSSLGQARAANLYPIMSDNALRSAVTGYNPDSPQSANAVASAAQTGMLGGVPAVGMIKAYHGSPYDFEQFDMNKIGTGEGAQTYGHGLYFAENPAVAQSYKQPARSAFISLGTPQQIAQSAYDSASGLGSDPYRLAKELLQQSHDAQTDPGIKQNYKVAIDNLQTLAGPRAPGHGYEVAIDAHPDEFLDWDKPLSEQSPQVQKAVGTIPDKAIQWSLKHGSDIPGASVVNAIRDRPDLLSASGIKGIRYLDQGSRGSGEGTHNYVVFDAKTISILKKYGLAGLTAGAGAAAAASAAPSQSPQQQY